MNNSSIVQTTLEKEIQKSYLDYAMSVIVGRALPDVRDGLKPVHRRVLYAMYELKNDWNKPYKKSARIVGDTMGKYHPHGDGAIYDAIVRMAQDFSMRYLLVDGHGNFGSVDGDSAAASRYTEIRLSKMSHQIMADLEKETVNFIPNYDNNESMPEIMPTKIPNLLINGSSGIAVGMATNIPPHNLREVIDACICLVDNPESTVQDLIQFIQGPDFPTSGIINGKSGVLDAYKTGRGKIYLRAKADFENTDYAKPGKAKIVITELPYMVNKAKLCEKVGQLARDKKIDGITAIRDESSRQGMRVVIEYRRGENPEVILNQLYTQTQLQVVYGINMVCLDKERPKCMDLKSILACFIEHRQDVLRRRFEFDLRKARRRVHVLEGLTVALSNLDEVIEMIRAAKTPAEAKEALLVKLWPLENFPIKDIDKNITFLAEFDPGYGIVEGGYQLSTTQAQAILDLRLHRLTGLERSKLVDEYKELVAKIIEILSILHDFAKFMGVIRDELIEIRDQFGDDRRTQIIDSFEDLNDLDLIKDEPVVVTKSNQGYLKAQSVEEYKVQARGGRGKSSSTIKDDDVIDTLAIAMRHESLLCFTNLGRVYTLPVHHIPLSSRTAKGKPVNNYLPLLEGEKVQQLLSVRHFSDKAQCVLITKRGVVKKTPLDAFSNVRSSGIIAITMRPEDELVNICVMHDEDDLMLFSDAGKAIRFAVSEVRATGRTSQGVLGMRLPNDHRVISAVPVPPNLSGTILIATENGYGKRTDIDEFRRIGRGGQGVIAISPSERNGKVVGVVLADLEQDVFLVTNMGTIMRLPVNSVSVIGRNTQGVRLIQMSDDVKLVGCQAFTKDSEGLEATDGDNSESNAESVESESLDSADMASDDSE